MNHKTILITGCSSGIGYHTAVALKQRGYQVFAGARKAEDVARLAAEGLHSVRLDVNDADSIRQALATVLAQTGGTLDALFNNAGFLQAGAIEDLTRDQDRAQFETNVFGAMEVIRHVLPVMRQQGHGRIIQNSSILGIVTLPYCGAYNASKFALEGFSHTLRQELRGTNIHVSIINPGPVTSKLRHHALSHYQQAKAQFVSSPHAEAYHHLEQSYFNPSPKDVRMSKHPDAVVKVLIHALESKRPHIHYYVGWTASVMAKLKRLLPDAALDWVLSKVR